MRTIGCILVCLAALSGALSSSAEARTLLGPSVRVALEGGREWGVGLRGDASGWRLSLDSGSGVTSVVFIDETAASHDKWVLEAQRGPLRLDAARFVGGHAYRVEVRRGATTVDRGLVYLYPTRGRRNAHVDFSADRIDLASALDEGERDEGIRIEPKSSL